MLRLLFYIQGWQHNVAIPLVWFRPYFVDSGKFLVLRKTPFNLLMFSFTLFTSSSGSGWLHPRLAYERETDASLNCSRSASATAMASCVLSACELSPSLRSPSLRDSDASFCACASTGGGSFFVKAMLWEGEVCVPTSREKSSVGSEQVEASSDVVAGTEETIDSSFERREERWDVVASERS